VKKWFISTVAALLLLELLGWCVRPLDLPFGPDSLPYQYHDRLGWFPRPSAAKIQRSLRRTTVRTNSLGFRGGEWAEDGRRRLLVIGDSFVWGAEVEEDERFTNLLQQRLPDWQVLNAGVAGYSTDQEYLLLQADWDIFKPAAVLLIFCGANDPFANSRNYMYGQYKPYFEFPAGRLLLRGVPVRRGIGFAIHDHLSFLKYSYVVRGAASIAMEMLQGGRITVPDPSLPLLQALYAFVESRGVPLAVGYESMGADLRRGLEEHGLPLVDLTTDERLADPGKHWSPAGHAWAAGRLSEELAQLLGRRQPG
jgi:hypothetical protein